MFSLCCGNIWWIWHTWGHCIFSQSDYFPCFKGVNKKTTTTTDMWLINSLWPELWKINCERREVFIFHNSGHEEFIKLILLLFCFTQRLSLSCDTQKWESVATRPNWKDLINSSAYWSFEITSSANREYPLLTKSSFNENCSSSGLSITQSLWLEHQLNFDSFIMFTIWTSKKQFAEKESFCHVVLNN